MSILLEALRKTEGKNPEQPVPTIHGGDVHRSDSDSSRVAWLALILIVTFFASGWFFWQQYRVPEAIGQPVSGLSGTDSRAQDTSAGQPRNASGTATDSEIRSIAGSTSAGYPRTPVESFQAPTGADNQQSPDVAGDAADPEAPAMVARRSADRPAANTPVASAPKPVAVKKTVPDNKPHKPDPIGYWELPDAIRGEVPEIRFSVLVYAKNPEDRFVFINGQRLREGDSVRPGLDVEEIRRDGVVFSYRLYQFLIGR